MELIDAGKAIGSGVVGYGGHGVFHALVLVGRPWRWDSCQTCC
ncbi:MAG: hypothetical protein R3E56_10540 [Burkholderiaceae bacterium]